MVLLLLQCCSCLLMLQPRFCSRCWSCAPAVAASFAQLLLLLLLLQQLLRNDGADA
jgi:hypothetical protein